VVDFSHQGDSLRRYDKIHDLTAFCLFYNNVAVDLILEDRYKEARRLLTFLDEVHPDLKEVRNNLGVLLIRQRESDRAFAIYEDLLQEERIYAPAFTNGIIAAQAVGRQDMAKTWSDKAYSLSKKDPFYLFNRAVTHYRAEQYDLAQTMFRKAIWIQPDSAVLRYWYARALLSRGRERQGRSEYRKALALQPGHPMARILQLEFPQLEELARLPSS